MFSTKQIIIVVEGGDRFNILQTSFGVVGYASTYMCYNRRNLSIGDVVTVVDASAPRNSWQMDKVIEIIPDRSGLVRQVKVKTATNVLARSIDKPCVLNSDKFTSCIFLTY